MRKRLLVLMIVSCLGVAASQTIPSAPATPPEAPVVAKSIPFARQIRKTVSFLQLVCKSGKKLIEAKGTGFFVLYPDKRLGEHGGFNYLVTNRHVAQCWDEKNHPMQVKSISARFNLSDGSSKVEPLNKKGNIPWILPTDESVDLALIPLLPDQKAVDYLSIPVDDFATDDIIASRDISEGTKIVFTGFFYQFPGERKMQPIIREGILAMMPDEELVNVTGRRGKVYLGDVHIFGGNSGSPVFINVGGIHGGMISGDQFFFLGAVSGYFYEDEEFQLKVATTIKGKAKANSGIAIIVPATAVKDLLEDPRLRKMRDDVAANWKP